MFNIENSYDDQITSITRASTFAPEIDDCSIPIELTELKLTVINPLIKAVCFSVNFSTLTKSDCCTNSQMGMLTFKTANLNLDLDGHQENEVSDFKITFRNAKQMGGTYLSIKIVCE